MDNDKVHQKMHVSRVKKGIERTLHTAEFEGIVIHNFIDEEIEWATLEERQRKTNNWLTVLITEYKRDEDRILEELGLEHKKFDHKDYRKKKREALNLDDLDTL